MDLSAGIEVKKEIYINRPSCTFRIISVVYSFCNMMVFVKKISGHLIELWLMKLTTKSYHLHFLNQYT